MPGFHVERRFGWDCHGLPVEYEIDKTLLGIKGRELWTDKQADKTSPYQFSLPV